MKGIPQAAALAIAAARPLRSIDDLARRAATLQGDPGELAAADAFGSLGLDRRAALWKVLALGEDLPLFADLEDDETNETLPPLSIQQNVIADYHTTGFRSRRIRLSLIRADLDRLDVVRADRLAQLPDKSTVRVAGLVLVRQRPATANGTVFMSLEDETGLMNLIIWKRTWERFRKIAKEACRPLRRRQNRTGRPRHPRRAKQNRRPVPRAARPGGGITRFSVSHRA